MPRDNPSSSASGDKVEVNDEEEEVPRRSRRAQRQYKYDEQAAICSSSQKIVPEA